MIVTEPNVEDECFVYWIKRKSHSCILSQGYIGISKNPRCRYTQHMWSIKSEKYKKRYRSDFVNAVESQDIELIILLKSTRKYCLEIEEKLRSEWVVGWNLARGGAGGCGTHNLSGTNAQRTYYNIRARAIKEKEDFHQDWEDGGISSFNIFYTQMKDLEGEFCLKEIGKGYNPTNLIKQTRSKIIQRAYSKYELDGKFYSIVELANIYKLKQNTISSRLRDGFSLKQALGIQSRSVGILLETGGRYLGKLSYADMEKLKEKFYEGESFINIPKLCDVEISCSNLGRLFERMGLNRDNLVFKNFFDEDIKLGYLRLNFKQIEEMKSMLMKGVTKSAIARHLGVSPSTITEFCKILKWYDYEKSLGG